VGIMCRIRRIFEAFDDSDRDLAQFVKPRVFPRYDQFLMLWPHGVEPMLT
jgi:hypothetical protein